MPQNTNLNVSPYFDDFDDKKSYQRVLFKPGTPIQARELTTLQSILQNQIEKGLTEDEIRATWKSGLHDFKKMRKPYLIY